MTNDDLVKQAIAELQDVVRCRCHPAFTDRGLHDPDCECDSADAVKVVSDRIEELQDERDEALNQLDSARHSVTVLEANVARLREALCRIQDGSYGKNAAIEDTDDE